MDPKYISPAVMWAIALSGAFLIGFFTQAVPVFQKGLISDLAAAILLLNWIGFFTLSIWQNREAENSVAKITRVQTEGTYSIVRHPIYMSDMGLTAGIFLYMATLNFLLPGIFVIAMICFWAGLEEEALVKKFGKKYRDYQKKVPKFIPKAPWA